jgi:phosphoribosylamine--glycine ligase
MGCAVGELDHLEQPEWIDGAAVCVVLAAQGYPEAPQTGGVIAGADADFGPDVTVFHAGTALNGGVLTSAGGRVLNVCARGPDIRTARDRAYAAVDRIDFPAGFHRRDIGWRAL